MASWSDKPLTGWRLVLAWTVILPFVLVLGGIQRVIERIQYGYWL